MLEDVRIWFFRKKAWIDTLIYVFYSIVLLLIVVGIDADFLGIRSNIPRVFMMDVELARHILGVLAGALLAIVIFTFSTITAVLVMYSNSFSSRVIENFVKNGITMKVLGVFIGGFFYCITALAFMNPSLVNEQVFAGTAGVIYSMVCLLYFIVFVQKVVYSVQDVNVVSDIYDMTMPMIAEELEGREHTPEYLVDDGDFSREIRSNNIGYLGSIDYAGLRSALKGRKGLFRITCRIGDFLVDGGLIGYLSVKDKDVNGDTIARVQESFLLQESKIQIRDYRYGLTKLTEIAARALSPGNVDPNTAIHCIRKMSALLGHLGSTDMSHISKVPKDSCKVLYESWPFEEEVYEAFNQIVVYGIGDPSVVRAILNGLRGMKERATPKNSAFIVEYATEVYRLALKEMENTFDREHITRAYRSIVPS